LIEAGLNLHTPFSLLLDFRFGRTVIVMKNNFQKIILVLALPAAAQTQLFAKARRSHLSRPFEIEIVQCDR
jgi:hypothetical protein